MSMQAAQETDSKSSGRRTIGPSGVYDRIKVFVVLGFAFGIISWARTRANPLMGIGESAYITLTTTWALTALFALEGIRQLHYVAARYLRPYARLVRRHATRERRSNRMDPWVRFRLGRLARTIITIGFIGAVYGALTGRGVFEALVALPDQLWRNLPFVLQMLLYMLLAVGQFAALFWFMSRGGVDVYMPDEVKTRFDNVWGQDHVIEKVRENIVFLEQPELVERVGGYVPSGILLWGPPGTGKTLIAEAVAGETGKPYVFVDPGAFQNMFVGVGILKVKSLFRKLRKLSLRYGGVIVFFDEADSLGNRGQLAGGFRQPAARDDTISGGGHDSDGRTVQRVMVGGMGGGGMGTLQALLAEIQGLAKPRGLFNRTLRKALNMAPKAPPKYRILIMMATNMPDSLDEALLRPGRIDRLYKVGYPTKEGRRRTYDGYFAKISHELTDHELDKLASMTPPRTGAEIKDLVNESLIHAMRDGRTSVRWSDVLHARYIRQTGLPEGFVYLDWERHAVAVHESCHAVAALEFRPDMPIDIATIERRGDVGGFVSSFDAEEQFARWRTDFEADVCVSLASLVGERMFFNNNNSAGVGGDLRHATAVVYQMLGVYGMGTTIASLAGRPGGHIGDLDFGAHREGLDALVEAELQALAARTQALLERRRHDVLAIAHALEVHQTITGDDIDAIVQRRVGPIVDGTAYDNEFLDAIERYHAAALAAQVDGSRPLPLPVARAVARIDEHGTGRSRWDAPDAVSPDTASVGGQPQAVRSSENTSTDSTAGSNPVTADADERGNADGGAADHGQATTGTPNPAAPDSAATQEQWPGWGLLADDGEEPQ